MIPITTRVFGDEEKRWRSAPGRSQRAGYRQGPRWRVEASFAEYLRHDRGVAVLEMHDRSAPGARRTGGRGRATRSLTSMSFIATANSIADTGRRQFRRRDWRTLNRDPDANEAGRYARTKAIMPVIKIGFRPNTIVHGPQRKRWVTIVEDAASCPSDSR